MKSDHIKDLIERSDQHKHNLDKALFTGVQSVSVLGSDRFGAVYVFEEESQEFSPNHLVLSQKELDLLLKHLESFIASDDDELSMETFRCTYGDIHELWKEKVLFLVKVIVIRCTCECEHWSMTVNEVAGIDALKRIRELEPQHTSD